MKRKILPFLMPVRSLVFIVVFVLISVIARKELKDISSTWSAVASAVNIIMIAALIFMTKNDGGFKKLINYEKGRTAPKQVIGMSILIVCLGMGGMFLAGFVCYGIIPYAPPMMIAPVPVPFAVINLIVLPVSTALAEDSLYLGCGVGTIKNRYLSVILPAFFFALQHCFIPTLPDARYMVYRFLSFLPLTVVLCIIYRKNRNPVSIMTGHAVIDLLTAGQILATSAIPGFYDMMTKL
ncbi:MAG: CPBP family intramembrane metalloprotease [Saccharofermentans sp.]|nr:CPBP family intramembrane metalloprotease [Saccharofermentans sp.]